MVPLYFLIGIYFQTLVHLDVDVEKYGAVADAAVNLTNATICTDAFNNAIRAVSKAGGGTVYVRAAHAAYKTGRIEMLSNVRLEIGPTTAVLGSHSVDDWTPRNASYPSKECALSPDF